MGIKWAFGVVILVLSGTLLLTGSAFADPGEITHSTATYCDDGSFTIELDFDGGSDGGDAYVDIEEASFAETAPPAGMTATGTDDVVFLDGLSPNEWQFNNFEDRDNFFTLSGDYDSVDALTDDSVDVDYRLEWEGGDDVFQSGGVSVSSGPDGDDNPDNDWEKCIISYCQAGDVDGGNDYEFKATPTNDCDPVRLCLDTGESVTVTEFQAETLNGEEGSCVPSEDPPASTTITEVDTADEVVETTDPVTEVSPAVEVAALPAAGIGPANGSKTTWVTLLGLTLIGIGGATTLMARRS